MTAKLIHKGQAENSWLQFYGAYPNEEIVKAIIKAGWDVRKFPPPKLPAKDLPDWFPTQEFNQPNGKGLFGGSTASEGKANIKRLREALKPFGIKLGNPRYASFQELI
jgi:hypothetical protein